MFAVQCGMPDSTMCRTARVLYALASGVAGALLVVTAFRVDSLNWMVDAPGWLVSHFISLDLHEGEGAFGFFLAIFLSWLCWSIAVGALSVGMRRLLRHPRTFRHR